MGRAGSGHRAERVIRLAAQASKVAVVVVKVIQELVKIPLVDAGPPAAGR